MCDHFRIPAEQCNIDAEKTDSLRKYTYLQMNEAPFPSPPVANCHDKTSRLANISS
jgi:hypothetical protein